MLKIKIKEIMICLSALLVLALVISTPSMATPIETLNNTNNNANNTYNNVPILNNTNVPVNNNTNTNVIANVNNTNANVNNTTGLPKTGLETTSIFVIGAFAIASIYAYKKIKEYNNI